MIPIPNQNWMKEKCGEIILRNTILLHFYGLVVFLFFKNHRLFSESIWFSQPEADLYENVSQNPISTLWIDRLFFTEKEFIFHFSLELHWELNILTVSVRMIYDLKWLLLLRMTNVNLAGNGNSPMRWTCILAIHNFFHWFIFQNCWFVWNQMKNCKTISCWEFTM